MDSVIKIVIVEEFAVYAEALNCLFEKIEGIDLVDVVHRGEELPGYLAKNKVDIVVTDLDYRDMSCFDLVSRVSQADPKVKFIAYSSHIKPIYIQFAIYSGIKGFVNKRDEISHLLDVIKIVHHGGTVYPEPYKYLSQEIDVSPLDDLSQREKEVARLMLYGRTNHQMSRELSISKKTVETHKTNIYRKLSISSTEELKSLTLTRRL